MTDVTNERWYQHSTILTLKGELAKQIGIADAARLEVLALRHMLDDAATATSELMATAKRWQDRAEAAEKREAVLREALTFYRDGWGFGTSEYQSGFTWFPKPALLNDCGNIAKVALEAKP